MNLCCECQEDFSSVASFDAHRVGRHAYSFAEGMRQEPPVEDGRRCLDPGEMRAAGLELVRKRWRLRVTDAERERLEALRGRAA